ncbi:MAG TPA: hypothetical protein VKX16_05075 [Chloroflexota bacterium]|nr:hypothetical protein [Chloroflexota bacterium]
MGRESSRLGFLSRVAAATAVVGIGLTLQASGGVRAQTQSQRFTISPVTVDLRQLHSGVAPARSSAPPFLHAGGLAAMSRAQQVALTQGPTQGVQDVGSPVPGTGKAAKLKSIGAFQNSGNYTESGGWNPPDGGLIVGQSDIISEFNTAFKIYDRSGALLAGPTQFYSVMQANTGCHSFDFDPTGEYDAVTGHYIMQTPTASGNDGSLCLAVSQTSDPTGKWWVYAVPEPVKSDFLDQPRIAIGSDAVYLQTDQFLNGSSFIGDLLFAVNKSQLESGANATVVSQTLTPNYDAVNPVRQLGTTSDPYVEPGYFISVDNGICPPTCSNVNIWKWANPFTTNTFTMQGSVTVTAFNQPVTAQQKGGSVVTNDARELAAYLAPDGTIYGAHSISCNLGGVVDCVQWYQVGNVDATPSLVQQGMVGSKGVYRFFPDLAVDKSGDVVMGYTYTSAKVYPGIDVTGRPAGYKLGTMLKEQVEVKGQAFAPGAGQRWGDYAATAIDPTNSCSAYHLEEYSPNNAGSGNEWAVGYEPWKFTTCS